MAGTQRRFFFAWQISYGAADVAPEAVIVADPYLELHTGPGRGYPIFFVAERGERVEVLKRRTDWFKVKTERGKEGWVSRAQIERALTEAGVVKTFRDVLLEDYLNRRAEFGFSAGRFEGDLSLTARAGYRVHENLLAELSLSQVTGEFSSSKLYYLSVVSEPFPDWRYAPFFTLGIGRLDNTPKATLVQATETSSTLANAGVGMRVYITRNFVFRLDYKSHATFVNEGRTDDFREWGAGFAFFF